MDHLVFKKMLERDQQLSQLFQRVRISLFRKRVFDVLVSILFVWAWLPVIVICSLAIAVSSGFPVFYVSKRRVGWQEIPLWKFRCMVKNAERIANRNTVPVTGQRFLNISSDSPLYTPVGRLIEKMCFTELPQFFHVLSGKMSLIGNRPLPRNVVECLRAAYPEAEDRFVVKCGMTGPAQLAGRSLISDRDRLRLEIEYCRLSLNCWTPRLDIMILLYTVLVGLGLREPLTVDEVLTLMLRCTRKVPVGRRADFRFAGGQLEKLLFTERRTIGDRRKAGYPADTPGGGRQ